MVDVAGADVIGRRVATHRKGPWLLTAYYLLHAPNVTCPKRHMPQTAHAPNVTCPEHHMPKTSHAQNVTCHKRHLPQTSLAPNVNSQTSLACRRVQLLWQADEDGEDEWLSGTVSAFNSVSSRHRVDYDDGDVVWHDLAKYARQGKLQWLDNYGPLYGALSDCHVITMWLPCDCYAITMLQLRATLWCVQ